ncbi:aromatic amino acid lyase [Desulfovibrio sp.]
MQSLRLNAEDYFLLVRGLAFAEIKAARNVSDVFGDELQLVPDSAFQDEPLSATREELVRMAEGVRGFFGLGEQSVAELVATPTPGGWAELVERAVGPRPEVVTFFTSGSTGKPKPILRKFFHLEQDAHHLGRMLGGARRVVALVPPHHIYGFIYTILIPKVLGAPCVIKRFQRPAAIVRSLEPFDAVVGIPLLWKLCSETKERFPASVVGVTSTGPCPAEVIHALRRQGLSVMNEIYGSSESGAMGHRQSPEAPLTLMATWKRLGGNRFAREMEDGSLSEPFEFQDQLEWLDETRFTVQKRLDSAVQVAGINIYPARVREALLEHPEVEDCAVRLMRPEEGDRLKAFVVPKAGRESGAELSDALLRHLASRVGPLEQPRSILFGPELPRNEMGKLADWTIETRRLGQTLDQALQRLEREHVPVQPGQEFAVDAFQPGDAWGVARLFYAEHGRSFPFEAYYIPERLREEHRLGLLHSAVARTPTGDIVGFGSCFRSSAPYHGVYEIGAHQVLADYRAARVGFALQEYIKDVLLPGRRVEVFFSEAPCHQVVTQKFAAMSGFRETALEIGLMPADAYGPTEHPEDRVSALLLFGGREDAPRDIHCPERHMEAAAYFLEGTGVRRTLLAAQGTPPDGHCTRASTEHFTFAQVARMHVQTLGQDFEATLDGFETQAGSRGARVLQVFLNLGEAWCHTGLEALRPRGYFLGGLLPRWFDDDGLLLQKVLDMPAFDSIKLYSQRAHRILDLIRRDIESNPACRAPRRAKAPALAETAGFRASEIAEVSIAGEGLTVEEVVAVARHGAAARLTRDEGALARVESSAAFIEWAVRTGEPIYGVNTGFGGMANIAIKEQDLCDLQNNLLRFLNVCAGDHLPQEDVRAGMLLRANSHMRGVSGVRRELIERLLLFLNNGVTPLVRDMGSIGASGDLAPLASITGALVGADACFRVSMGGEEVSCLEALERLGLKPLPLGPKEGLGMVNGTSVMTGIAANCLYDARKLVALSLGFHALAVQALVGSNQSFHPFIHQHKPHPGQVLAAEIMLGQLRGSSMCRDELDGHHGIVDGQPAQDRYSLRCLPQFLGPVLEAVARTRRTLETEINSANDNPLIDGEGCLSLHSGNFLGQYVAVSMDHLRYCLGLMTKHMDAQIALMVAPEFNGGLPASLVGNPARTVNMGLKGLQIAANSIMPLVSFYGAPIADRFPTHAEQFNQNINSQGFNAATLARKSLRALEAYVAMSLIFGVQAVSLRAFRMTGTYDPTPLLSPASGALYEATLAALGRAPGAERPLVWNDDEQSLEQLVLALRADIAADGGVVRAVGDAVVKLG